jgi:ribonuclease T2
MRFRLWGLASLLVLFAAMPALAQRETRGGPAGQFDFYVLALSWSSGFCEIEGDRKEREQCAPGAKLGFVLHGLWPQNERGYPTDCAPAGRTPSRAAMDIAAAAYPSEGLARHQWRKHGTCAGESPTDYFRAAKAARDRIVIPPPFANADRPQNWSPIDIERAFVAANPGLRADMVAISCKRGVLDEVRICLSRDLRGFRTCGEVDQGGCRQRELRVPAPR